MSRIRSIEHGPRVCVLLDRQFVSGPVDGRDEYRGYPFIGGGSSGYPDAPAVLRS